MAPEVLEGAISFDQEAFQRIDMYAVSLVLWEQLSRTADCDPFPEYKMPFEDQVRSTPDNSERSPSQLSEDRVQGEKFGLWRLVATSPWSRFGDGRESPSYSELTLTSRSYS